MAPTSFPFTYTGEPDIPAAIPPVSSMMRPDVLTRMKSIPGAIPSGRTPRISTLKLEGA
jgi:hypothetical protein